MPLLLLLLSFGTLLHQSLGQRHTTTHLKKGHCESHVSIMDQKVMIDRINAIRRTVQPTATNMQKMTWSNKAAKSAWQWAKQCNPVSSPEKMRTVDGTVCGETRLQSINAISWSNIIDVWVAKRSNFKYGVGAIDSKKDVYGYTQLIWYNTHEIGCAVVHCKDNEYKFFYVCHTCPAGNIKKLIPIPYKNGPSCDDCPNRCEEKLCTNL